MQDQYQWRASFKDGSSVEQRGENVEPFPYGSIDRSRLTSFQLYDSTTKEIVAHLGFADENEAERFFWTRRNRTKDFENIATVHVFGIRGKFVMVLLPDGSTAIQTGFSPDPASLFSEVIQ